MKNSKINFSMNIYYNPNDIIKETINMEEDVFCRVFCRMEENDCQDLYNGIEQIEDEHIFNKVEFIIENFTIEELKPFITIDNNSIRFDEYETSECRYEYLAYLVDVTFDVEKAINMDKKDI